MNKLHDIRAKAEQLFRLSITVAAMQLLVQAVGPWRILIVGGYGYACIMIIWSAFMDRDSGRWKNHCILGVTLFAATAIANIFLTILFPGRG